MTTEQLRGAIKAVPFRPFSLRVADGREIPVPHPDFIMYAPTTPRTTVVTLPDGTIEVLDLLLITGLSIAQPTAAGP